MKSVKKILFVWMAALLSSCTAYLDIVPDNVTTVEDLFTTRTDALNALAKLYHFMPVTDATDASPFLLGDEYICIYPGRENDETRFRAQRIMQNLQTSGEPLLGLWSGTGNIRSLHYYVAIRHCDIFMKNVHLVHDIGEADKEDLLAQAKFMKAYYAFLLIQQYGPIVIPQFINADETAEDKLYPRRASIDESFKFVLDLIDEAIPKLRSRTPSVDLGQVDQAIAKAIKARVLVFRASRFYNGNEMYSQFTNKGESTPLFPQTYDKKKWEDAIAALNEAITFCKSVGLDLYKYEAAYPLYDTAFVNANPTKAQTFHSVRNVVSAPWNNELIWGKSDLYTYRYFDRETANKILSCDCNIMLPGEYSGAGYGEKNHYGSGNYMAASYRMLERYYTDKGLPIDEDKDFRRSDMFDLVTTPGATDPAYTDMIGLLQPNFETVRLYLNRELRFYANLGISGGYFRAHKYCISTSMFSGGPGGYSTNSDYANEYLCTGIGIQKMVHPESGAGLYFAQVRFPYPIIRMADLYLMLAEALNEYQDTPDQKVWDAINTVRRRAGIPDVQVAWANARTPNRHTRQDGMRDIILQERAIELAFEGIHYWDMVRHRRAASEFSKPILGWNHLGTNARSFFVIEPKQVRTFTQTSYLWPIAIDELNTNSNLVQNPGW
ncbi:MAG: RagB/SusD family nutrient uptake outer membrane protein [Prevotellaceae bacterium]|nr:RagB/SusD family nutrient uptake outer membrane protein [Prevotellaceae bacterium]